MSLGRREARHQTVAAARTAGVSPEDYWSFKPGQKVMTADGFAGKVEAVLDGPIGGTETYDVVLDNGMGGGQYTASLLQAMPQSTANVDVKTAADDYPELGTILVDRPPLALSTKASLQVEAAYDHGDPDEYTSGHQCPNCGSDRSLESAIGVIKCEDCGYSKQNGQTDGWGGSDMSPKAASLDEDDPFRMLVVAAGDADFRFHVTASFADVRSKAKRLRSEGHVNILAVNGGTVVANVKGDHHVYETEIVRMGSNAIAQWHCGCKWGSYAWGRSAAFKRFEGRLCSHALALHFEAQSQGMFGKQVAEEEKSPAWLKARTRVVTDFDRDRRSNVSRPAQPRKRDLARTYSAYSQVDVSPLETLVTTALAQGEDVDEVVLACRTAGLDATPFIVEAAKPEGYQTTAPGSHHKDRSGDLTPCARGGCGHPEGIHGEDGGHCDSQGCACTGYKGAGSPKEASLEVEARRHRKKRKSKKHTVRMSYGAPWHGVGWGLGGWGGYGYGGYYGGGEGGSSGGGDGGGDGGGGGGSEGAAGRIRQVLAEAFPMNMGPTYTPGNDVRSWEKSNGAWNATGPHNEHDNPGSTGYASQGDPKEFNQGPLHTRETGMTGSLHGWPTLRTEARDVVPGPAKGNSAWDIGKKILTENPATKKMRLLKEVGLQAPSLVADVKDPVAPDKKFWDAPKGDYDGEMPKWLRGVDEVLSPYSYLPQRTREKVQMGDPKDQSPEMADVAQHPVGWMVNEVGKGIGNGAYKATEVAGDVKDKAKSTWKKLFGALSDEVTAALHAEAGSYKDDLLDPAVDWVKKVDLNPNWKAPDSIPTWMVPKGMEPKAVPAPRTAPPLANPTPGGRAGDEARQPMVPAKTDPPPVPGKPGTAEPVKPGNPQGPAAQPKMQEAPAGTGTKPGTTKAPADGKSPKADGGKGGKTPKAEKVTPKAKPKGRFFLPDFGKLPVPDYERASNTLINGHGIGSRASLADEVAQALAAEAALTPQQDFANGVADTYEALGGESLTRYEATLDEEPEPALPQTDGADDDLEVTASTESVEDIVAQFQATAGAQAIASGSSPAQADVVEGDVAAAAKAFLQTEAMKTFSPAEQKQIIDEGMDVTASNLDRLDIKGTHYEPLEAALASADLTEDDDLDL